MKTKNRIDAMFSETFQSRTFRNAMTFFVLLIACPFLFACLSLCVLLVLYPAVNLADLFLFGGSP